LVVAFPSISASPSRRLPPAPRSAIHHTFPLCRDHLTPLGVVTRPPPLVAHLSFDLVGCCIARHPSLSYGWLLRVVSSCCCLLWAYASCLSFVTALGIVHCREMMTIFLIVVVHSREVLTVLINHDVYRRAVGKRYTPSSGTMLHGAHVHQVACRLLLAVDVIVVKPKKTDGHRRWLMGRRRRHTQPEVGCSAQEFPPLFFFQNYLAGTRTHKTQKFGWCDGKTAHPKSRLTDL
jgi:hypothetical protein